MRGTDYRSPRCYARAPARKPVCEPRQRGRAYSEKDANVIEIPGYRILRQLGRGGMATVYLATQESVEREVALKVMAPALLVDENFGERFLREARIAAKLHHRHVVGVHDVGRAGDCHYIAMEYLGGGVVQAKDGSTRDVGFALRVAREIATALNYAQEKGFVHRDVKPDNILLREDGSAVLTDFGIARACDSSLRMTRTGAIVGTPHYMSPEQARGRPIDGRADLYSLGIVLYEMLVGRVPYHADDSLAVGIKHITEPVPQLPRPLAALQPLLDRLLAKEPEDRFQTGNEVAAAIAELERDLPRDGFAPFGAGREDDRQGESWPSMRSSETPPIASAPMFTADARERAEPAIGRIDQIAATLDAEPMRADRDAPLAREARKPRRRAGVGVLLASALLLGAGFAAWHRQDALRQLLPHTEFNDTLARAQRALDAGQLVGNQGDSARELFLAARAQDPDNDIARRGLDVVGRKLIEQAEAALAREDAVAARGLLDDARELLGGGTDIDRVEQTLRQRESKGDATAQMLEQARAALDARRLIGADGAATLYQRVLDGDKDNALAQAGLRRTADALAVQARSALAAKDVTGATARSDDIARILPSWPGLPELLGQIAQARDAARAALEATLDHAEAQVRAGDLTGGEDSALDLFRAVLKQDPASARAKQGLRAVAQAFIVQANAAIEGDNPDEAGKLLDSAAQLAPDSPDLRAARINLRELRERQDIAAQRVAITPAQSAQVQRLLGDAARAAAAGDLILPPGDSAYDKYRAALAIDRDNREALAGLARLPIHAKKLFAQALTDGAPQRARTQLDAVRQIAPEDAAIAGMSEKLANAFLDQADARLGEGRRADATRALDAARALSPANPRIATLSARLQVMQDTHG
ncbi:protein kinase domain-containing protein [Dokdonella sp.]|uniref:serine/threonine-protein kinase n=1 Tax=Dokdonella sp. TaxID=2291710 RepID=UPI0037834243